MVKENKKRVFFALWPDDNVRQAIVNRTQQSQYPKLNGRIIPPGNLHITLHFIGNVTPQQLEHLHNAVQAVQFDTFEIRLNHFMYFYTAKVLSIGCRHQPDELIRLHKNLAETINQCGLTTDSRPYVPHVTIMRKLNNPGILTDFNDINWTVRDFALFESISSNSGVEYKLIHQY